MTASAKATGHQYSGTEQALRELIARLEVATGPDRELDRDIAVAFDPRADVCAHKFTGSIDAALTLLPRDYTTNIHNATASDETFPVTYSMRKLHDGYEAFVFYDTYPTWNIEQQELANGWSEAGQAISLCIAALKTKGDL